MFFRPDIFVTLFSPRFGKHFALFLLLIFSFDSSYLKLYYFFSSFLKNIIWKQRKEINRKWTSEKQEGRNLEEVRKSISLSKNKQEKKKMILEKETKKIAQNFSVLSSWSCVLMFRNEKKKIFKKILT